MIRPPLLPTPDPYAGTTLAPGPPWFVVVGLLALLALLVSVVVCGAVVAAVVPLRRP